MSSLALRVNGGAVPAGTLIACTAIIANTGGADVTVDSVEQTAPSTSVAFIDLAPGVVGQRVPALESITVPFSIRTPAVQNFEQFNVSFDLFLSDGTKVTSNTAQVQAIPQSLFLTSPTADGLLPQPGSLNFNSNSSSALLGAV